MNFDVIILGAGPAGTACAKALGESGLSVCLVEKASFPKNKTCAGILTYKTVKMLEQLGLSIDKGLTYTSKSFKICNNQRTDIKLNSKYGFTFIDRYSFDYFLFKRCQSPALTVMERAYVSKYDFKSSLLTLSDGTKHGYRFLVVAEGVHSPAARLLNMQPEAKALCIQTNIKKEQCRRRPEQLEELCLFYTGNEGYSWFVPGEKVVKIGSGILAERFEYQEMKTQLMSISHQFEPDAPIEIKAAYVPFCIPKEQTGLPFENVIFVGDSGGFVCPITGEGIYYALKTGFEAAEAIIQSVGSNVSMQAIFWEKVRPLHNRIAEDYSVTKAYYTNRFIETCIEQLVEDTEYLANMADELVSTDKASFKDKYRELLNFFR